jgi:hypothetical protein
MTTWKDVDLGGHAPPCASECNRCKWHYERDHKALNALVASLIDEAINAERTKREEDRQKWEAVALDQHDKLTTERAKREHAKLQVKEAKRELADTEQNSVDIHQLNVKLTRDLLAERDKLVAERAKREEAEGRLRTHDGWCDAVGEKPYLVDALRAERERSAALQAEVKRLREALVELLLQANKTGITYEPLVEAVYEARHALSTPSGIGQPVQSRAHVFFSGTCTDCGEIIDVRCAHRLLQSERAKREEAEDTWRALRDERMRLLGLVDEAMAEVERLEVEVERMRGALIWYAESANYMHTFNRVPGETVLDRMYSAPEKIEAGWRPVVLDAGKRARAALSQSPEKKT